MPFIWLIVNNGRGWTIHRSPRSRRRKSCCKISTRSKRVSCNGIYYLCAHSQDNEKIFVNLVLMSLHNSSKLLLRLYVVNQKSSFCYVRSKHLQWCLLRKAVNYFCKNFHLRCLTAFWMCLWTQFMPSCNQVHQPP